MTKYIARLDGKIVGKRTTKDRTYTHAVVAQRDEEHYRKLAYDYIASENDVTNFGRCNLIARCEGNIFDLRSWEKPADVAGQTIYHGNDNVAYYFSHTAKDIIEAKSIIAAGWLAYVESRRQDQIKSFEREKTLGHFEPHAITWCGRPDLAEKAKSSHWRASHCSNVWVVPAEVA